MQHVEGSLNVWRNACAFLLFFTILGSVSLVAQTVSLVATFNGANGQEPNSIMQGIDGNFYGTTAFGGTYREGTIFQVTPSGSLTSLYSFCAQTRRTVRTVQVLNERLWWRRRSWSRRCIPDECGRAIYGVLQLLLARKVRRRIQSQRALA